MTATHAREHVSKLASVEYDRARSTPYHALYQARSDRYTDVIYEVRQDVERDLWTCTCKAYEFSASPQSCKHVARARRHLRVEFFHAYFLGWGPGDLRAQRAVYEARVEQSWATEDDWAGLDAIELLTQYGDRGVAA